MIEDVDQRLKDWIGSLLPDIAVAMTAPVDEGSEPLVSLYLLDLSPSSPARGPRRSPLQIKLGYLVTTWAAAPETSHSLLFQLLFAAMQEPEFEVELTAPSGQFWQSCGVVPRPAFMLRVPLRFDRPEARVVPVRSAVEINAAPLAAMAGILMGPDNIPIANARVELPGLRLAAQTDNRGRFRFPGVPVNIGVHHLRVQARGSEFVVEARHNPGAPEPLIIHINPEDV
jgi:hypothetical protein